MRRAGETRAKTAMTGNARNARLTKLAANTTSPRSVRRIVGSPLDHHRRRLDDRRRCHARFEPELLHRVTRHDCDDARGLGDEDLDLRDAEIESADVTIIAFAGIVLTSLAEQLEKRFSRWRPER